MTAPTSRIIIGIKGPKRFALKSLRIIIFAGYYLPYRGGYVESLHGLSKGLVKAGHEVTIVTTNVSKSKSKEIIDGVQVVRLPGWHLLGGTYPIVAPTPKALWMMLTLLFKRVDVVSTQTRFFVTSFLGALYATVKLKPLVHTERGAYHSVVRSRFVDFASRVIDHTMGWFVVRRAKRNVGVSQAACTFIKHLHGRNVSFIPNGVAIPTALTQKKKVELRKKWGLKSSDRVLLFVGRLVYAKGVQDVLPFLTKLIKKEPHLKFVIVGSGTFREILEIEIEILRLDKHVKFLGLLDSNDVVECMQLSDWFVNPSHSEGLPRSVLEAASAGLPIVASDVGGTKEIIEHEKSGLIFNPKKKSEMGKGLQRVILNSDLSKKLGAAAQKRVEKEFTWPKIIGSYVDLMSQLV